MFDHQKWGVVDYIDSPQVLDAAVVPIPGSDGAYLQIVASLARTAYRVHIVDGIQTRMIGIYTGVPGKENLVGIFGITPVSTVDIFIPQGSRVCLRAMSPGAITVDELCIQFMA